jgi:hypothetical protein
LSFGSDAWTVTMEERNALGILELKTVKKIYGPVKEEER